MLKILFAGCPGLSLL